MFQILCTETYVVDNVLFSMLMMGIRKPVWSVYVFYILI